MAVILTTGVRTSTVTFGCRKGTVLCPHKELCANLKDRRISMMLRYMALSQMLCKHTCRITIIETNPNGTMRQVHPRLRFNRDRNTIHPLLAEVNNGS